MINFLARWLVGRHEIEGLLAEYFTQVEQITLDMRSGIDSYLKNSREKFHESFERINATEHRLDMLRRDIEEIIYGRRLLPDTRGDVLGLLENMDKIPNRVQSLTREMILQKVEVPELLHVSMVKLAELGVQIVRVLIGTAQAFLDRPTDVKRGAEALSDHEHAGDVIEQEAVALLFTAPELELAHKLQLRRLIDDLGGICDIAEDVGDRLVIAALKRIL